MKALVIAAGEGKRFRERGYKGVKPLYSLLGLSLLERTLLSLREAGVKEVVVVLGYRGEEIKAKIGSGDKWGIKVDYVVNERWFLGNGISVLSAREFFQNEESFLLTMADHIWDLQALTRIAELKPNPGEVYVGADYKLEEIVDLEEATRLQVEGIKIRRIGKGLKDFNAVDCGVFHATPYIFEILAKAEKEGKYTLSEALQIMAEEGNLLAADIGESWWIDVDTPEEAIRAEQILLKFLPAPKDGLIARYINRRFSLFLTRWLARTDIHPNQISLISFILCLGGAFLFGLGLSPAGGILAQLASIVDGVDGEIARLKFLRSAWGEFLDAMLDRYGDGILIIGMALGAYDGNNGQTVFCWLSLALLGAPMSMLIKEKFRNIWGQLYLPEKEGIWANLLLGNRDGRLFVIMLAGIFHSPLWGLAILAITSHLLTFIRIVNIRKFCPADGDIN
ncbi:CDP-L-myo-inositol myo-inositolphosphotransferase [Thermosyntropha lipolytica DSM 11003]|uniref:Bifunctional IPC transferase and DIPP synthase n=1 Tax=Thermosyntropha lipolytica DSM 11003 TaxID=1123382 RepID=A0A1M5QTK6_9FIRM|nr:sugar phosphate nucleotidyltransferase [Thermosyntropha lipolytica]SHH17251.1 CDP-L-myo-inositol myo-inositolphosphotransferase [Thermosyntropha lipolytica DSM 11003]